MQKPLAAAIASRKLRDFSENAQPKIHQTGCGSVDSSADFLRYTASERGYRYGDIRIRVKPGVFHPGFFFSTKVLLKY
ncbi:MAG: hypothetical protein R3C26_22645 [Calditrichia bacterium]